MLISFGRTIGVRLVEANPAKPGEIILRQAETTSQGRIFGTEMDEGKGMGMHESHDQTSPVQGWKSRTKEPKGKSKK